MRNKFTNAKKTLNVSLLICLLCGVSFKVRSQSMKVIQGTVYDSSTNTALPDVNVHLKGSNRGGLTNVNGQYSIRAKSEDVLVFSFIGYGSQEIPIGSRSVIDVVLKGSATRLGEVVVNVGYGRQKKATVTGAITSVNGNTLQASPATNVTNSLAGHLPGLTVLSQSGEPGNDGSTLRIRGSNTLGDNSPLIVVDGIANRSIEGLDPSNIESVTVLKDASAAIYGSEAANGVILITTKRGKTGKPKIDLSLNQGWSKPTVIPKTADAATYAQLENEIDLYRGSTPRYTPEDIQKYRDGSDPWKHPNTNWYKEILKNSAQQRYANLSLSGGTEALKYFISIGSNYQDGIYKHSSTYYSKANFRTNLDAKVTKDIRVSFDIAGRQEYRHFSPRDAATIFSAGRQSKPLLPAYWPNGLPGPDIEAGNNPVVVSTDAIGYNRDKRYMMQSNMKLDINIPWIKGLSVTGNAAIDKNFVNQKVWIHPWTLYSWDYQTYDANGDPVLLGTPKGISDAQLTQYMADNQLTTLNALINYETTVSEKHNVKALFGVEHTTGDGMNFNAFRRYFVSEAIDQLFAGGNLEKDNSGTADHLARLNYFGRFNYNYRSKYLAEFVFRYDGSYIFPENKRFGFFPGVSLGWLVSQENFWKKNLSAFNYFKLRGSWGQTGNDRIEQYQYLSSYSFIPQNIYVFNQSVEQNSMAEIRIPNPSVTWEVANQSNIGFDGEMFHGKLTFSADYFYNLRSNILWQRNASVPGTAGLTLPRENIGKIVNKGFEFQIGYNNKAGDFSYSVSVNGGSQKNRIKFWDEAPGSPDYQKTTGHPMNSQLLYNAIGIFKDQAAVDAYPHWAGARPGDIIFEDVNKDGKIDGLDQVRVYKTNIPTFQGGFNLDLGYKGLYAILSFQGASGAARAHLSYSGDVGNFTIDDVEGRWTPDNPNATKPRTWNRDDQYWSLNSGINNTYWLRSNDYIRLKSAKIGYNIPDAINRRLGISALSIYFSGFNLLTFTKLTSYDPETEGDSAYPPNKVYNVGLNLNF